MHVFLLDDLLYTQIHMNRRSLDGIEQKSQPANERGREHAILWIYAFLCLNHKGRHAHGKHTHMNSRTLTQNNDRKRDSLPRENETQMGLFVCAPFGVCFFFHFPFFFNLFCNSTAFSLFATVFCVVIWIRFRSPWHAYV